MCVFADGASKPVAKQAVKKRTESRPAAKKMPANINIPEDLSSAVKPATKRAPLGSKLPKLANMMTVDAAVKETQENKATANRRVSPVLVRFFCSFLHVNVIKLTPRVGLVRPFWKLWLMAEVDCLCLNAEAKCSEETC